MTRFRRLISEVHRRSLWQVLSIYLVSAWIGYQVVLSLTDGIGLPDWVPGFAIVLFVIGLPIVMATAFVQEGPPARRERQVLLPDQFTLVPDGDPALASSAGAATEAADTRGKHHIFFTWRKAILGGVAAFVLLAVLTTGYMVLRNSGVGPFTTLLAAGTLDNRERVLIAEFRDVRGDTMLAQAVTQAFRVSFSQSDVVNVVEPSHVKQVLARMQRESAVRLDDELAREVSIRDNIRAYVSGEIAAAGGRYTLAAKLISADDGSVLAATQQMADDSTQILPAVEKLSRKLREKIGESLRKVRASPPVEAVTTSSLQALRKYSQGVHAVDVETDFARAASLLEEAIALDSTFAMAWRKLAVVYFNGGAPYDKLLHASRKAYQYRDRLTDVERYHTIAFYHFNVTEDMPRVIEAYTNLLQLEPNNRPALNNLGLAYMRQRDFESARQSYAKGIAADSTGTAGYINLHETLVTLGKYDEARALQETVRRRFGESREYYNMQAELAAAEGDYARVQKAARQMVEARPNHQRSQRTAASILSSVALLHGKLREADQLRQRANAVGQQLGMDPDAVGLELTRAETDVLVRAEPDLALKRLNSPELQAKIAKRKPENQPLGRLAIIYAAADAPGRAREYLARHMQQPPEIRGDDRAMVNLTSGFIALAEKRYADALSRLRQATQYGACERCSRIALAHGFYVAGQADSAIAHYEYFVNSVFAEAQLMADARNLAVAHERLAELYQRSGNRDKAVYHAARFIELWQDADAELQPRVAAKRALVEDIRRGRT